MSFHLSFSPSNQMCDEKSADFDIMKTLNAAKTMKRTFKTDITRKMTQLAMTSAVK